MVRPSVEPNILPEDPETRILYLRHWNTIRTEEVTGNRVQDRYNFTLHDMTAFTFPEMVRRIFRQSLVESQVTEHVFPSIKILTTNGTGDRVVVGFLVPFIPSVQRR
jgi:hypothetical protein